MKLLILSDLHLEFGEPLQLPRGLDYDLVVLAGDISAPGHKAVDWAKRESTFGGRPVIFVAGNHEFYEREMARERRLIDEAAAGSHVHVLHRRAVEIAGVRFLGATLWTDFQCPVTMPGGGSRVDVEEAMAAAALRIVDYRLIKVKAEVESSYRLRDFKRRLTPADTLAEHAMDRDWLRRELEQPCDLPTVVVTHHAPSALSIAEKYADSWVTPAFVSDLPGEFFEVPRLWVHGHTHTSFDYRVANCHVVCNPRGYRMRDGSWENPAFTPLVVEV